MKAMFAGILAAIVIAIAASYVLEQLDYSSANQFSTENVRL